MLPQNITDAAARIAPSWADSVFSRCLDCTDTPLPRSEAERVLRLPDSNKRLLPSRELFDFARWCCERTGVPRKENHKVLAAVLKFVQDFHGQLDDIVSDSDRALMCAAEGVIEKQLAFCEGFSRQRGERAAGLFEKAAQLLSSHKAQAMVQKSLSYLAADLRFLCDPIVHEQRISQGLIEAMVGRSPPPPGLFFKCATKLFRLRPDATKRILDFARKDLVASWGRLPPAVLKKKDEHEEAEKPKGLFTLGEILDRDHLNSPADIPAAGSGITINGSEGNLRWQPLDRFALCVMLYRSEDQEFNRNFLAWESHELLKRIEVQKALAGLENGLTAYVSTIPPPDATFTEEWRRMETENTQSNAVDALLGADRAQEAVSTGIELLSRETDPHVRASVALSVSKAVGESQSAAEEFRFLNIGLASVEGVTTRPAATLRARLHRRLAIHHWNQLAEETALEHIAQSIDCAADALNIDLLCHCLKTEWEILKNLGRPTSPSVINGFIQYHLNRPWASPGLIGYLVEDARMKFISELDSANSNTLRELRQELWELDWGKTSEATIAMVKRTLKRAETSENVFLRAEIWTILLRNVTKISADFGNDQRNDFGPRLVELLARDITVNLAPLRARRTQIALALSLARWVSSSNSRPNSTVTHRVAECIVSAITLRIQQISHIRNKDFAIGPRDSLTELVGEFVAIADSAQIIPGQLLEWVRFCKLYDSESYERNRVRGTEHSGIEVGGIPDYEASEEPEDIEAKLEQRPNPALAELQESLKLSDGAVVEFFLSRQAGRSFLLLINGNEFKIVGTSADHARIKAIAEELKTHARKAKAINEKAYLSIAQMFVILRAELDNGSHLFSALALKVEEKLAALGRELFPEEATKFLAPRRVVYIVPHSVLLALPLHLLPTATGKALIDTNQILYISDTGVLAKPRSAIKDARELVYVNTTDPALTHFAHGFLNVLGKVQNQWDNRMSALDVLSAIESATTSFVFVHGCTAFQKDWLTRLELNNGIRLATATVANAGGRYNRCEIYLFACHSAAPKVRRSRETLGLITAFLRRDASAVFGCLWPPEAQDALKIAEQLIPRRRADVPRSAAFAEAVRAAGLGSSTLERILRFGTFVFYGTDHS